MPICLKCEGLEQELLTFEQESTV
jgi:hypothetical protein